MDVETRISTIGYEGTDRDVTAHRIVSAMSKEEQRWLRSEQQEMLTGMKLMEEEYHRTRAQSRKDVAEEQEIAQRDNWRDGPGIVFGFDTG